MSHYEDMVKYCNDIVSKKILSCEMVMLACKRTLNDLKKAETDKNYPFYFDKETANRVIEFANHTKQYEGQWKGQYLNLLPWQKHCIMSVFGWKNKSDGTRRFRKAYIQVGRKSGKSSLISVFMLYELLTEPGCQALAACTKRDTAKIIFNHCIQIIRQNEALAKRLKVYNSTSRIVNESLGGYFEALASDADRMDGLNPAICCIDEIASMSDYEIVKRLQSGMGARRNGLIFEISSASDDMYSAGAQELKRLREILRGVIEDDTFFGIAYQLDNGDDWRNEKLYIKANPSLGITVSEKFLHDLKVEAMQQPSLEGEFRTRNLGQFISPITAWLQPSVWQVCIDNASKFKPNLDKPYYAIGAVDLSKRNDLTAFTVCVYQDNKYYLYHKAYFPINMMAEKLKTDNELWGHWTEKGIVTGTNGSTIDYGVMFKDIEEINEKFHLEYILFDPYNSNALIEKLQEEYELIEVQQSLKNMSPFIKSFEECIRLGVVVDDNPLMQWEMSHVEVYRDANENLKLQKPDSQKSGKRIDHVVTSAMSVGYVKALLDAGEIDLRTTEESVKQLKNFLSKLNIYGS